MRIQIGDGSGNEHYRTCAQPVPLSDGGQNCEQGVCGLDCEPEPFDAGAGKGIRIAFSCPVHGLHGVTDPFEGSR